MKRVFAILSIFLTTACSLFEDRGMCPDFVVLDLDYFPDRSCDESFKLMHWHDDFLVEKSDMPYNGNVHSYDIPVSDGMVDIAAFSPCDSARFDEQEKRLIIPLGEEFHPFYGFARRVYVNGADTYIEGVRLYKQFVRLSFRLRRVPFDEYDVWVMSDVCGISTQTFEPIPGAFLHELRPKEDLYECILPRQTDKCDLRVVIKERSSPNPGQDIEIPIGESIRDNRYDWNSPELADIYAYVDVAKEITVVQIIE